MLVNIKNIDPCWVEYGLTVELPDATPEDEIEDRALALVQEGTFEIGYGPEVQGTIEGMDNEYEITQVERKD